MSEAQGAHAAGSEIKVLREVKTAEAGARDLKTRADAEAKAKVEAAVREARRLRDDAEEAARKAHAEVLAKARTEAEGQGRDLVAKGRTAAESARARAKGPSFDKAVDRVLAEFKRRAGGS